MLHPDYREQFLAQLQAAIDGPSEFHAQFRVLWQDGATIRWVETIGTVLRDDSGHPLRAIGVAIDITERQGAEQALRESEMRFRAMAETVPDVIYTCRPDGQCEYINHRFYELRGRRGFRLDDTDSSARCRCQNALVRGGALEKSMVGYPSDSLGEWAVSVVFVQGGADFPSGRPDRPVVWDADRHSQHDRD
jgi:PAS domain-containing protein